MPKYVDFSIIVKIEDDNYIVTAFDGLPNISNKIAEETVKSPSNEDNFCKYCEINKKITSDKHCEDGIRAMGQFLFDWIFCGSIRCAFMNYINCLKTDINKRFRIRLCLHDTIERSKFLWECMYVSEWEDRNKKPVHIQNPFLSLNPNIIICRQTVDATFHSELAPTEPLKILAAYHNPLHRPIANLEMMFVAFINAMEPLRMNNFINLRDELILGDPRSSIKPPDREEILAKLKESNPHVFVFFGHGYSGKESGLALGKDEYLPVSDFANTVKSMDNPNLRLVFLPNCETSAMAAPLAHAGIPAVVAMQRSIEDRPFVEAMIAAFFDALRQFKPIEECMYHIRDRIERYGDWYIPVLHLQTEDSQLFASEDEIRLNQYRDFVLKHYNEFPVSVFLREGMTLESNYVECKVGDREENTEGISEKPFKSNETPNLNEWRNQEGFVERDVKDAIEKHNHIIITGEAGDGKSTLLRYLARSYAGMKRKVPIVLSLRDWSESKKSFEEFLHGQLLENTGIPERFGEWLWGKVRAGDAAILMDALDEVYEPESVIKQIQMLSNGGARNCIIVVTCRKSAYRNQLGGKFHNLEWIPFKDKQIMDYAKRYFGDIRKAKQFIGILNTDSRSKSLAGNGLMLSLMCYLYDNGSLKLPSSPDELYDHISDNLLKSKKNLGLLSRTQNIYPAELKRQILEEIAFHSLFCTPRKYEIDKTLINECIDHHTNSDIWNKYKGQDDEILDDVIQNSDLLHPIGPVQIAWKYRFFHLSFHEYFAARYIASKLEGKKSYDEAFLKWIYEGRKFHCDNCNRDIYPFKNYFWHPEWTETILLLAGVMEDAHKLLEAIGTERQNDDWESSMLCLLAKAVSRCKKAEEEIAEYVSKKLWYTYLDYEFCVQCPSFWELTNLMRNIGKINQNLKKGIAAYLRKRYVSKNLFNPALINESNIPYLPDLPELEDFYDSSDILDRVIETLCKSRIESNSRHILGLLDKYLEDENEGVRMKAAEIMGHIGDVRAVDVLIHFIKASNFMFSNRAAWALINIGNARAVDILIEALEDDYILVRRWATIALGNIGDAKAVGALIKALKDDDWEVRQSAARAIVNTGGSKAVDILIEALKDDDWEVRQSAAEALGETGDARTIDALISGKVEDLRSDDHNVFIKAAFELAHINYTRAVDELIAILKTNDEKVHAVIRVLDYIVYISELTFTRSTALRNINDAKAVDIIIGALKDDRKDIRRKVANILGNIGDARAIDSLIEALKDDDGEVRKSATGALGEIGNARAVDILIEALKDDDWKVRQSAVAALGETGDARAIDALIKALKGDDRAVRKSAAEALRDTNDARAVDALIEVLKNTIGALQSFDMDICMSATYALKDIGDARAVDTLIEVLDFLDFYKKYTDSNEDFILTEITPCDIFWRDTFGGAVMALGKIGDVRAVDALSRILMSCRIKDINIVAADALGNIGDARAINALMKVPYAFSISHALKMISKAQRIRIFLDGSYEDLPNIGY